MDIVTWFFLLDKFFFSDNIYVSMIVMSGFFFIIVDYVDGWWLVSFQAFKEVTPSVGKKFC